MAEKNLNTRIQLKWDSYENWTKNNPILKQGEAAIVVVPAETGAVQQEPAILIKIGDDKNTRFNDLPFVSAKAADIYSWAKAEKKPTYTADEIDGLSDYISGEIQDTNTQYKLEQDTTDGHKLVLSSKEVNGEWAQVAEIVTVDTVYDDTALAGRVTALEGLVGSVAVATQIANAIAALKLDETYDAKGAAADALEAAKAHADAKDEAIAAAKKAGDDAQSDLNAYKTSNDKALADEIARAGAAEKANADAIDALEAKVGEVPADKTVVQMIADAQTAATYDDTKVKADIKANADAIALLNNGSTVEGSVDYKIAQAVAAIMENPDETMNSINELVTWINGHATDALALSNKVEANEDDIAALEQLVGSTAVATQISYAIAAALKIDGVDKYALAADLTAAIGRIAALEAKSHEHANKTVLDGITAEKVAAWDGAEQAAKDYADDQIEALGMADYLKKADAPGYADILTKTDAATMYEPLGAVEAAIEALKIGDYAKAADLTAALERIGKNEGDIAGLAGRMTTAEGEIAKKANDADLAAIAKTGNVNDLVQTEGDVLVFNCGTSSTVI